MATSILGKNIFTSLHYVKSPFSIGATIKDTRTKSRGRVEVREGGGTGWGGVEGRGENVDNCN